MKSVSSLDDYRCAASDVRGGVGHAHIGVFVDHVAVGFAGLAAGGGEADSALGVVAAVLHTHADGVVAALEFFAGHLVHVPELELVLPLNIKLDARTVGVGEDVVALLGEFAALVHLGLQTGLELEVAVGHKDHLAGLVVHQAEHRQLLVAVLAGGDEVINIDGIEVGVHASPQPVVVEGEVHGVHPLVVVVAEALHLVPLAVVEEAAADLVLGHCKVGVVELVVVAEGQQGCTLAEGLGEGVVVQVETHAVDRLEVQVVVLEVTAAPVGTHLGVALLAAEAALLGGVDDVVAELLAFRALDVDVHVGRVDSLVHTVHRLGAVADHKLGAVVHRAVEVPHLAAHLLGARAASVLPFLHLFGVDTETFEILGLIHQSCAKHFCIVCVFHNLLYFNVKLKFISLCCHNAKVLP